MFWGWAYCPALPFHWGIARFAAFAPPQNSGWQVLKVELREPLNGEKLYSPLLFAGTELQMDVVDS